MDVEDVKIIKELRAEKFGLSLIPIARQNSISHPAGGATIDTQARTAINSILNVLDAFGLTA